jgi:hypothetical protein
MSANVAVECHMTFIPETRFGPEPPAQEPSARSTGYSLFLSRVSRPCQCGRTLAGLPAVNSGKLAQKFARNLCQ